MTDSHGDAKRYAFKLLARRGRSESELRERLTRKGFPGVAIARAVGSLRQAGYLDDCALAEDLKREALEKKMLAYQGAKVFMMKRGLPAEVVDSVLGYDEERELQNVQKLVDKQLGSKENYLTKREKRRLWNFLARRGYSSGIIRKALKDVSLSEEEDS